MSALARSLVGAALSTLAVATLHTPLAAQSPDLEAQVLELLGYGEFESIADPIAAALPDQVLQTAGPLSTEQEALLRQTIREEFSVSAMKVDVVSALTEAGDPATVAELLDWLPSGTTAELDAIRESYEPPLTLEEYGLSLEESPPAEDRILVMAEWARTMQAGPFYVALQLAQLEAVHTITLALNEELPAFIPPTDTQVQQALQNFLVVSILEFLRALEPADAELVRRATAEYGSASGQWFVTSYSLAVEEAIDRAAARVAARVQSRPAPPS